MTKLQSRNHGLDLLRVLACYMVLQVHAGEFYYIADGGLVAAGGEPVWACWLNSLCRTAVPLFVMLSGFFLLPVRERTRDFFARRFVRVVVPFLVWCVLYAIYQFLTGRTDAAGYAENVNLYTAGHGLKSITRGSAPEAELLKALGLDPKRYFMALAQTVGK